jgi:hypothetical protein
VFQKPYCLDLWGLFDGQSFLMAIEHFSSQQTLSEGVRTVDGHWCARLHLLGFCLLACACTGLQNSEKEKRIGEAIRCFFQAASGGEANEALQTLFLGTGYKQNLPGISFTTSSFLAGLSQYMMFTLELLQF